jgi:hypothetical protein
MKTLNITIILMLAAVLILDSCEPVEDISDIPEIHFKEISDSYIVVDNSITTYYRDLTFTFKDGDADIGVPANSSDSPNNLILIPFRKLNGVYDSIDPELYQREYKIKEHDLLNSDKAVQGEIKVSINYPFPLPFDTIRYNFYIIDQAGNQSNTDSTADIAF